MTGGVMTSGQWSGIGVVQRSSGTSAHNRTYTIPYV